MALVIGKEFQRTVKAMTVHRSQQPLSSLMSSCSSRRIGACSIRLLSQAVPVHRFQTASSTTTKKTSWESVYYSNSCSCVQHRFYSTTQVVFKEYPPHTIFPMPALSPTMESGTIASWQKSEGDSFSAGDVLCSIETDKASMDFEAQDDGVLAKILRQGPSAVDIRIGTPICVIVEDANDVPAFADFSVEASASSTESATTAAPVAPPSPVPAPPPAAPASSSLVMPSARHLSQSKGLDASLLHGTGKGGRVTKGDVLLAFEKGIYMPPLSIAHGESPPAAAAIENASVAPPPPSTQPAAPTAAPPVVPPLSLASLPPLEVSTHGTYHDIPNSTMRKVIARRLTESKSQVPHYYASVEVELDQILALRKQLAKDHDVKVSVNDLVIRCSAMALRDVPQVNALYDPKTQSIQVQSNIDISVAVATPNGLITPIVPNTDRLGLESISSKVRELAGRAREGKLLPHEYQGGTFCVTNLGMFGIDEFSAVINPPQAAILAVGGGNRQVVPTPFVLGSPKEEQAKPMIKTIMTARLSADRRVIDEPTAALFLAAFARYMNQPQLLLL